MSEPIFFVPARFDDPPQAWSAHIEALYERADLGRIVRPNDLVAIKMHFGERGNAHHLRARHVKPLVECVKTGQGKPFLTDTSTLYAGGRSNAVDHLMTAHEHGFTIDAVGAPVIMSDGLFGAAEFEVPLDGQDGRKVALAADVVRAQALIAATHVTGHCQAGLGGLMKNLAMGTASRKGKLHQHSQAKPHINAEQCVACGQCAEWCPADAIEENDDATAMVIQDERCIGCGECLTVCRNNAVKFDWKVGSAEMQRKMAEQAAGLYKLKRGKIAYVSYLVNISKDCDCLGKASTVEIDDIGVLAGFAPLAVEQATLDLIRERSGQDLCTRYWPEIDPTLVLRHGQTLGMGSTDYELVEVTSA